ncbi:alpha/beta fold hydrolase [Salinibacterium sp. SYSU T00001]|uniref:alpha/beta fold hydrolase n=1 Tax=Homoserinimonas sedimenticola TaxID=2986805 RepID=UPI0022359E24|nr:alpha/beta fold hydrolase [Salinibacterium sedimenticola]MCW4386703.1 alpha/beta fold hydrolase [Salinibacterium sedimenticola]
MSRGAQHPPAGLPGLDPRFSRLVRVPSRSGAQHEWHLLDNAHVLAESGVEPQGTILCVHGNPTWSYLWRGLVAAATRQALAGGPAWRVVAVDQLEMGFSERTGRMRRLADRVADLGELTDALGLGGPVVTLGHDWGGVISLGWAVDHPELVAGVMALNTAVHQPGDARIPAPLRLALARPVLETGTRRTTAFLDTTLRLAHPPLPREVRSAYSTPYASADRRRGIRDFVADIPVDESHPSHAELERIAEGVRELEVPALFVWGPRDPIFGDRYLADLTRRMPHADVHRVEGAGHLVAEDADYAEIVLRWLEGRLSHPARAVSKPAPTNDHPPLWSMLDSLRDSDAAALVEMAPRRAPGPRSVSWRLLARRVDEIASGLVAHGVRRGDRVSVLVPAGADLTAVLYACLRIGAVVVVADAGLGVAALSRAVRGAWPDHVIGIERALVAAQVLGWPGQRFSTRRLATPVARALGVTASLTELADVGRRDLRLPTEPGPGDPAAILFTSGSTGPPKGVAYTHGQLSALAALLRDRYEIAPGDGLVAGFAPFALLGPALGATSVTPDMDVTAPSTLTAVAVAEAAAAARARVVFASPAALTNVLATAERLRPENHAALAEVTTLLSAGAPLSPRLLERVARLMPAASVHTPYGMTEGLLLTDVTLEGIREAEGSGEGVCVGVPAASARVLISALDERGRATGEPSNAPGVTGEIVASAPHLKDHYDRLWATQAASEADVTDSRSGERWHRTGDVGHLDAQGRLWVEGRLPHVIVTDGAVLTPVGIEQRAEAVPGIRRAAAVGVGPRGTQQLVIVAETEPAVRGPRLADAQLAGRLRAATRLPLAAVLLVPLLPTDIRHNSKIDRGALAEWASAVLAGGRLKRPARGRPA